MSIAKANILSFVNSSLNRKETNIDVAIQMCLNDLSNASLLIGTDATQGLIDGSTYLSYPTGLKELISIVLNDSADRPPLLPMAYEEYLENMAYPSKSEPEYYSEFNKRFYLWKPSGGVYTSLISFYKYHPQDVGTIEFGDEFTNAINYGSAAFFAMTKRLTDYLNIYMPMYQAEKVEREANGHRRTYIVRD
ncbi:MAG: hypothetical protein Q7T18_06745 [Sedimentisphaerales bacterium]|nr:hypothetical protein [Sedimentisphaerales bacterium]